MSRKALFIAPSAYPLGGVAVWLDYLVPGLAAHGWAAQAGLVTGRWHDLAAYRAAYPRLHAVAIANPTGSAEGRIRAIADTLRRERPDIAVAVNIVDTYAAVQRVRREGRPIKVVMALHGIAADLLADLKREAVRGLDAVIATNQLACRLCDTEAGVSPDRVLYAPYGVDADALGALPRVPRSGPLRIVWVGRLEQEQKRVRDLPAILAALDHEGADYHLRIVGDGPERAALAAALASWLGRGRVELAGALPAAALGEQVYARADVLLITSSWETGPIVAWEAMAAGVAVVSSRYVGSGREGALQDGTNCLLFPTGEAALAAQQLAGLAADTSLCARLAAAGQALVRARYSINASVHAWAQALDAVLALPPRASPSALTRPAASGRLDRWLGLERAETVRRALGRAHAHAGPGGEWPHTASEIEDEPRLLRHAAQRDVEQP
ncbi:MAG: hypothetical protein Fur0019_02210 [Tibeticola sp.]